jgi:hypothetical protein
VANQTREMIVHWRVGFVHGVMNTDNMSILDLQLIMALMAGLKITTRNGRLIPLTVRIVGIVLGTKNTLWNLYH